jgi:hypothetical protein
MLSKVRLALKEMEYTRQMAYTWCGYAYGVALLTAVVDLLGGFPTPTWVRIFFALIFLPAAITGVNSIFLALMSQKSKFDPILLLISISYIGVLAYIGFGASWGGGLVSWFFYLFLPEMFKALL